MSVVKRHMEVKRTWATIQARTEKNAHESKLIWKLWYFWVPDLRPLFGPHNADMWAIFCHKLWVPFLLPISDRRKETTWNPFLGRIFDTPFLLYFWDPNHKKLDQNWDSKSGPKSVIEFQYVSMCVCVFLWLGYWLKEARVGRIQLSSDVLHR